MNQQAKLLLNPFERFSERTLLSWGILSLVIGSIIAFTVHGKFDGVLDLHFGPHVQWYGPFLDNLINIFSLMIPLMIVGRIVNNKTRIIDVLTTILIARIPFYLLVLFNVNNFMEDLTNRMMSQFQGSVPGRSFGVENLGVGPWEMLLFIVFAMLSILVLIWMITLLYRGFKTATNIKSAPHIVMFSVAIIIAEIISKIIFSNLNY